MRRSTDGLMRGAARLWTRGIVGVMAAGMAVFACYGVLALTALLPLVGIRLLLDETVWATAIVVFTLVTLCAVTPGFRCHRSVLPSGAAMAAVGLILYALLVDYRAIIELSGFVVLIAAVTADVYLRHRAIASERRGTGEKSRGPYGQGGAAPRPDERQIS